MYSCLLSCRFKNAFKTANAVCIWYLHTLNQATIADLDLCSSDCLIMSIFEYNILLFASADVFEALIHYIEYRCLVASPCLNSQFNPLTGNRAAN